jgi:hypothetical protein
VLYPKQWLEDVGSRVTCGEAEIRKLSQIFRLSEREMISGFREFLEEKKIPDKLFPFKYALDSFVISSSECKRGFSQINLIVMPSRASLTTSALLFIKIIGPPLMQFYPTKYVKSWPLGGHHSAVDSKSRR